MTKLKLGTIIEDRPIRVTIELPAQLHRELIAYAEVLGRETGQAIVDPAKLIAPMVQQFIATDRGFAKARRARTQTVSD